jgi:hypothetical protein
VEEVELCKIIKEYIADEEKAVGEYDKSSTDSGWLFSKESKAIFKSLSTDEAKHAALLKAIYAVHCEQ